MGYARGAYALGYVDDLRDPLDVLELDAEKSKGFGELASGASPKRRSRPRGCRNGAEEPRMPEERVDVLIVGAGALAETRMNILCLEQGDWMDPGSTTRPRAWTGRCAASATSA